MKEKSKNSATASTTPEVGNGSPKPTTTPDTSFLKAVGTSGPASCNQNDLIMAQAQAVATVDAIRLEALEAVWPFLIPLPVEQSAPALEGLFGALSARRDEALEAIERLARLKGGGNVQ